MLPRERFAWVWLSALVVIFGLYFTAVALARQSTPDLSVGARIGMLAVALGALAVVVGIDRLVAWLRGGAHRHANVDERDRLIELRSSAVAYYVLMAGMCVVGVMMPFGAQGWEIVHAALLAIVVAEIVHYGLVVVGYRRGWRV